MNEKKDKSKKSKKLKIGIIFGILILIVIIFLLIKGCEIKKYTVKFNSDGGTIVKDIEVKENETVKRPKDPSKNGYYFEGWYYKNKLFNFNTKITKNITLKAYWNLGINLNKTKMGLIVGQNEKIEILKLPNGISEKDLIYSSSDESIAIVDKNGNIKGLKKGTVMITVKSKDGKYSASVTVTVTNEEIEVQTVLINGPSSVNVGNNIKLSTTFKPSNATNQKLTWKSSNSEIATVDQNGNVKGLKVGTVTITVTTANGKTATKKITVRDSSTSHNSNSNNNNNNSNSNNNNNSNNSSGGQQQEQPKQDKYSITFTRERQEGTGNTMQYTFVVYKNGSSFNDFLGIECGGVSITPKLRYVSLQSEDHSAKLTLSDGSVIYITVNYRG